MKTWDLFFHLLILVSLSFLIAVTGSCKKDPESPTGSNKILIGITTPDTVSYLFAKVSTQLNSTGGNQITEHGHCWSIESGPNLGDDHTSLGDIDSPGKVTSDISGLSDYKKYFIRPYFTFQGGTIYGIQKEINTLKRGKPVAITGVTSEITISSVKISGSATFDSGLVITQKGVCWDTIANPTLLKSIGHSEEGAETGSFISSITQLSENKHYYFCSYATNDRGTSYGEPKQFITVAITVPTVSTYDVTDITINSAVCGGFVSNDGSASVTGRGVCWNITGNPTLTNCINKTQNGTGVGNYTSQINGLLQGTTYYVTAYATNEKGTSYGDIKEFITAPIVIPTVLTSNITNITKTTAASGGNVTNAGNGTVMAKGVCWSTSQDPTTANNHTTDGTGIGIFVSSLTGLTANTQYYVRAYATNEAGTAYGNQLSFTTLPNQVPSVITNAVTNITQTTATSGGNVTFDGGASVTARGICWSTSSNPSTANNHTIDGTGTGVFVSYLTNLNANTPYYVRAYATNSVGTNYGNELTFTTSQNPILPTVTTTTVTNITQTTATSGGNVTSDGGAPVTARGVCWSTSSNPSTGNSYTIDGGGTGEFVSNLTSLIANTVYYVRAYATNSVGTEYGNQVSFTTHFPCGSSITINHLVGDVAPVNKTVTYGTVTNIPGETSKCWITSNLGADHQATAVNDATEASAGWYWQFNRKQGYKHDGTTRTPNTIWINTIIENLDWQAGNDPCSLELGSGWRLPVFTEWENLVAVGGWTNWNGPWNSGLKMHAAGSLYDPGLLWGRGSSGKYWSSTQGSTDAGGFLYFTISTAGTGDNSKEHGFTLRCLRDN